MRHMNNLDRFFTKDPVAFAGAYFEYLSSVLKKIDTGEIGQFVKTLLDVRERGATVFFIGNGGSAATAMHFANDLSIGWTVAITAFDGGKMKLMADQGIHVPTATKEYGPAEDAHMILDHLVGAYLMRAICAA
jgi:phosphoheptose isomerase